MVTETGSEPRPPDWSGGDVIEPDMALVGCFLCLVSTAIVFLGGYFVIRWLFN